MTSVTTSRRRGAEQPAAVVDRRTRRGGRHSRDRPMDMARSFLVTGSAPVERIGTWNALIALFTTSFASPTLSQKGPTAIFGSGQDGRATAFERGLIN